MVRRLHLRSRHLEAFSDGTCVKNSTSGQPWGTWTSFKGFSLSSVFTGFHQSFSLLNVTNLLWNLSLSGSECAASKTTLGLINISQTHYWTQPPPPLGSVSVRNVLVLVSSAPLLPTCSCSAELGASLKLSSSHSSNIFRVWLYRELLTHIYVTKAAIQMTK